MSDFLLGERKRKGGDPSRVGLIPLMLPMLLEHILYSTVNLLDVLFISRISDHAVNSVSVPGQYLSICQILAFSVSAGAIICVNQAIGMGNLKKVNRLATIACAANALWAPSSDSRFSSTRTAFSQSCVSRRTPSAVRRAICASPAG